MCALDGDIKEHSENWILLLDNVTMFLQKNQLNKSSFSNYIYIFLPGIVFFRTPGIFKNEVAKLLLKDWENGHYWNIIGGKKVLASYGGECFQYLPDEHHH